MAEEIIDIRERIEKMRIQIEEEALIEKNNQKPMKTLHKISNSNISLSLQDKVNEPENIEEIDDNLNVFETPNPKVRFESNKQEIFPSVSLSVKNPISNKILVTMIALQLLSNFGIFYFLFLMMER
jgi:hypothetical protein